MGKGIKIKNRNGFTIIELVVVIVIIAILATISIVGFTNIQQGARNTQRSSQINTLAEALEKYYSKNGEYPSCASIASPVTPNTVVTTVLPGLDPNLLTAPTAVSGTNSVQCTDPTSPSQFGYIVLGSGNSYTLKYKEENTGTIIPLDSRHHSISPNYPLVLTGIHCTPTGAGSYSAGTSVPIDCGSVDQFWIETGWTGSVGCSGGAINKNITVDGPKACTSTPALATVAMPIGFPSTLTTSASTTWSWPGATCSGGNTLEYRYEYTIPESGYDSGWATVSSATTSFTSSTWDDGHHYNLVVQAHCFNAAGGDSGWTSSITGNPNPYVATPSCYLTVNSAGNGSVGGGNNWYDCGTSPDAPVISASANTYYYFSGWSGSGCPGGGSNPVAISMTGTITCTGNFPAAGISANTPSVWNNGVYATQVGFSWSGSCNGPATQIDYVGQTYLGATYLEGADYGSATNANSTTMVTPPNTYTYYVSARCYNPVVGWSGYVAGSTNYYRDYWYPGAQSGAPNWVYWADDGTYRRYKSSDTVNSAPQASGDYLVSPQANPGVDFGTEPKNYPAQNNCKAIGGRTPTPNELIGMWNGYALHTPYYYHDTFSGGGGYRSSQQRTDKTTYAWNINMTTSALESSAKTNTNPVRCVKD